MGIILDTSIIIEAEKDRFDIEKFVNGREEEPFGLSVISVAELLHSVHRANTRPGRLGRSAFVERVIDLFMVYPFDITSARIYADIWANLQKKGTLIGAHDLMIGSTALALGFSVASFNTRHFDRIEGLKLEIPNPFP